MGAKDVLRQRAEQACKSEEVEIGGARLRVRGMMLGERNRVMTEAYNADGKPDYNKLYPLALGLCVFDAESGQNMWNPNTMEGRDELAQGVTPDDADLLLGIVLRLSGMDKEGKQAGNASLERTNSASSSPSATESLPRVLMAS